ncbi:Signal transduction histidine kinase [Streptomyces sp. DvalAA-14]|uniref:sensor histidine kinase n=1 Tax=unclassified Streptomyces TaxID=2593676 RepID=UPI00081B7D97|nr:MULTISPECIES: HAMP domain-containing sensor histidine kinase [unclassified Streptomyces]MYS23488.1 HAMP domain-containing protein [Streptomyces sp. SID4948]SCE34071.1 Signal transduction histidine kinase [Streptomyces sp. DvalAA-14]
MRWALVRVCLAVTAMVVIAFAVPLGLVVKELARDRALTNAERQAAAVAPALAITSDRSQLARALATTQAGGQDRIALRIPGTVSSPAVDLGTHRVSSAALDSASANGEAVTVRVPGGLALLRPTAVSSGTIAVVEVFVPDGDLTRGVTTAWLVLSGVGLGLIITSVGIADRLGSRMIGPAVRLAGAAHRLGEGDLGVRVPEAGPGELRAAAAAFNAMADQVVQLLASERELAADLSHRLRTPLTVLRLNTASLGDGAAADQTRAAVAQLEGEVDQIIRAAREHRTPGAVPAGCDAAEVIRERMAFWSALAEDEAREVRTAGADRPVRVPVARAELTAALDAMLGNVFRHTPEGTAFAVDVHSSDEAVIVLVSDAGPGVSDPVAAVRRGHGDGGQGSTGLGLDIVRRVAESTGGDVAIGRSVLGGAEIRVWLARDPRTGLPPAPGHHRRATLRRRR